MKSNFTYESSCEAFYNLDVDPAEFYDFQNHTVTYQTIKNGKITIIGTKPIDYNDPSPTIKAMLENGSIQRKVKQ